MPTVDLSVLTGGDIKALTALEKGLKSLNVNLETAAVASTKFNVASGDFVAKVIGMNKAGQTLTVTLRQVKGELTAETVALENNAKAAKNAQIAKANLAKISKNVAGARSVLDTQFTTKDYKPADLARHREQISQITKLVATSIDGYKQFDSALNAIISGAVAGLSEEEHAFYNILKRMSDREVAVADKMVKDSKSKADKIAKSAQLRGDAQVAKGTLTGAFDTKNLGIQQIQSLDNKLETLYRQIETGKTEFKDFADAVDIHFSGALKGATPKAQQIIQLFKTLEAATAAADKKIADADKRKVDRTNKIKFRKEDAQNTRAALEQLFPSTGLSAKQKAAQEGRFNVITKGVSKGTSDLFHVHDAINTFKGGGPGKLDVEAHAILKILNDLDNAKKRVDARFTNRRDASVAKGAISSIRAGGALDTKNLSINQLQAVENKLNNLYNQIAKGSVSFGDFRKAVDHYFHGIGTSVTPEVQKIVDSFKTIDTTIATANKKVADKDQAKKDKNLLKRQRKGDANTTRAQLETLFPQFGLTPEQSASQDARINTIVRGVSKGTTELKHFNEALTAYFTGNTRRLDEEGQKVLKIINNISNYQDKISKQNTKKTTDAATKNANEAAGKNIIAGEKKKAAPNFKRLDSGAKERVQNQFDRIQNLFSKGLDSSKFIKAFEVANQGATHELDKIEREVRHRLERINIELDKGQRKPIFSNLFSGGSPTDLIKGALLAKGITELVSSLSAFVEKSAEYSKQIALIRTITQDANVSTQAWKVGIAEVSNVIGRSRNEVANAGYDLLSNQITKGADSFRILQSAGNLANTTNSRLQDSVNILSSAIQSFGLQATDTDKLAAAFFTTIDLGRVKIEEIANVFGRPALAAKTLGVSFQELAASIITISQTGIDVEQTNTLITNVFHKLLNPTKELQALYDRLGVSTGEMFVKTYTFTGVLKILQKETGGSAAKLAELFNEIRGEQGINALIDRLGIYEDSLDQVTNSTEKYKKAIDEVNASSGQKLQVELQKINNYYDSFKDQLLDGIVTLNEYNGGLANTVVELTQFSVAVAGGGTAALFLANQFDLLVVKGSLLSKILKVLAAEQTLLIASFGVGFAVGAMFEIAAENIYKLNHLYEEFYERRRVELEKFREQAVKENKRISDAFTKPLEEKNQVHRQDTLQQFGNVVANLKVLKDAQKEAFQDSGKYFENSAQVFIAGLKKKLDDIQSIIKEIEDLKKEFNKTSKTTQDHRRDFIYDYAHKVNELNVEHGGADVSKQIDQKRLSQLRGDAVKVFKDPDLTAKQKAEELNRIYDQRRQILEHMATLTHVDQNTGQTEFVYGIQKSTDRLRANDRERLTILHLQNKALQAQEDILKAAADKQKILIKDTEDAIAKVVHFKPFEEGTGKLTYGTPEETKKRFEKYAKDALDHLETARQAGHGTSGDLLTTKQRLQTERETLDKTLKTDTSEKKVEELRTNYTQASDPAKRKALEDANQTAQNEKDRAKYQAQLTAENLHVQGFHALKAAENSGSTDELGISRGPNLDDLEGRRKLQEQISHGTYFAQQGDHEKAIKHFDEARRLARKHGIENEEIAGPEREVTSADGKKEKVREKSTFGTQITQARAQSSTAQEASQYAKQTDDQYRSLQQSSNKYLQELSEIAHEYGDLGGSTIRFRELSQATWEASAANIGTVNSKMGETVGKLKTIADNAVITAAAIAKINSGVEQQLEQSQKAAAKVGGGPSAKAADNFTGGLIHRAGGGLVFSPKGSDNIPVLAANHEFMMNQQSTARFLPQLIAMNSGFDPSFSQQSQHAKGDHYNFGDMHINVGNGQSGSQTAKSIVDGIRRGIRRGTLSI